MCQELDEEMEKADILAIQLIKHVTEGMGASACEIPIEYKGKTYTITVKESDSFLDTMSIIDKA